MAGFDLRAARASDAQAVVEWFEDRATAVSWGGPTVPDPLTSTWLTQELLAPSHVYRAAITGNGELVGFYGLQLFPIEGRAHVRRLAAAPSHRRQGIARLLLWDAARVAAGEGMNRLSLNVYGSNSTARTVYERLGWRHVGSSPAAEDTSGVRYAMELQLSE